ncbi:MAG: dienelactone hydrolase [Desulfuromonadaceae bacterium GWC2_58_13]|nr:MAG: dienelactone hydrolase [Desulfuromonadaceae bacterium GWC2_58_13]
MKTFFSICLLLGLASTATAAGNAVGYAVEGTSFEGYYTAPAPTAPLILLIHDWDGLTGYELKRADMLAAMGYAVFAADLFGKGVRPTTLEEKSRLTGALYNDRTLLRALLQGALKAAETQGAKVDNAVAVGYCFGGAAVLELARSGAAMKGFVTFHGGLATPAGQDYRQTRGTLLVFHGTADSSVSMNEFAALAVELETAGVSHEMTTYSGAPHAFTVFGGDRYRKEADEKSWRRFGEFLTATLR